MTQTTMYRLRQATGPGSPSLSPPERAARRRVPNRSQALHDTVGNHGVLRRASVASKARSAGQVDAVFHGEYREPDGLTVTDQAAAPGPAPAPAPAAPPAPGPVAGLLGVGGGPAATIPLHIRGADSPAGMADRIPPRVDTPVTVRVAGWSIPMLPVTFSIEGGGASNGTVTINGGADADVTAASETLNLRGGTQTAVGSAGNLRLVAHHGGTRLAESDPFSVSSIPQDLSMTFHSLITGTRRGFVVAYRWDSDSGAVADLDQADMSESVEYDPGTGVFTGVGTSNSGYLPANAFTRDRHSTPVSLLTGGGFLAARQTFKFRDKRSGSVDIPMRKSGYQIGRLAFALPPALGGGVSITTSKVGSATTANGIASAAAAGSVTRTQAV